MPKIFKKGLIAVLPVLVTAGVLYLVVDFLVSKIGRPIGWLLWWAATRAGLDKDGVAEYGYAALGTVVAVLLVFAVGVLFATFLGKRLYRLFEALLGKIPVLNKIYPYARQFTDFLISEDQQKAQFKTAVAVPFPSPGRYALGFVTGDGMRTLNESTGKRLIGVFVPTAPAPMTGFILFMPREDIVPLPISIDEAFRTLLSFGILIPSHQSVASTEIRMDAPGPYAVPSSLLPGGPP